MTRQETRKNTEAIREMIHRRFRSSARVEAVTIPSEAHLDEDTVGAFVEARLGETESARIISHLIACGVCRRTSAQLIRLESEINAEDDSTTPDEGPGRLRQLFEDLASRVIPPSEEDAVFAYQNPENTDQNAEVTAKSTSGKLKHTESATESEGQIENKDLD